MSVDGVSSAPVGNGSALDQLVAQYESIQRRPIDELELKRDQLSDKSNTYSELKKKSKELKDLAMKYKRTGALSEFGSKTTSSSDEKILTSSANAKAIDGTHTVVVQQLAKADTLVSNQETRTGTNVSTTVGAGAKTFDITVNGTTFNLSVTLTGSETNSALMQAVVDQINGTTDIKVNASVVNDTGTTSRISLASKESGYDNRITIADTSGTLITTLGLDDSTKSVGTAGGYLYEDTELNSKLLVDNIAIEASSNKVTDVITGVTLDLKSADATKTITVGVDTDVDGLKTTVKDFMEKYNAVVDYINGASFIDKTTYLRGPLAGESAYQNMRFDLRAFIVEQVTGLDSGQPSTLAGIGVTISREGKLEFTDEDEFKKQAELDPTYISDLFNSTNGLASKVHDFLDNYTQTGGIIDQSEDTIEEKTRNINKRIKRYEARLEVQIESYRRQFAQLQELMSGLQSQQASLSTVLNGSFYGGGF